MPGFADRLETAMRERAAKEASARDAAAPPLSRYADAAFRAVEDARKSSPEFRALFGDVRPFQAKPDPAVHGKLSVTLEARTGIMPWNKPPLEIKVEIACAASGPGGAKGVITFSRIAYGEIVMLGTTKWCASLSVSSEQDMFDTVQTQLASFIAGFDPHFAVVDPQSESAPLGPRR